MSFLENLLKDNKNVHIHPDKQDFVEQTLHALIKDGRKMLHVVADFDYTLTLHEKNGERLPTTYAILEDDARITLPDGSKYGDHAIQLLEKYYPIAGNLQMSMEEKVPLIVEWYDKVHSLILSSNLNKAMLRELVDQSKMELRKHVREFITELLRTQTPVLIFSAGLGDIIELFLQKEIPEFKHNHESSHIISNFIDFDTDGKLLAFSGKCIHSLNKNEQEIHDAPYYQSIVDRANVLLLGDSINDIGMIESVPSKLEAYKNVYDIVICGDQSFDVPCMILNAIV